MSRLVSCQASAHSHAGVTWHHGTTCAIEKAKSIRLLFLKTALDDYFVRSMSTESCTLTSITATFHTTHSLTCRDCSRAERQKCRGTFLYQISGILFRRARRRNGSQGHLYVRPFTSGGDKNYGLSTCLRGKLIRES
jgi:hypothetical protein